MLTKLINNDLKKVNGGVYFTLDKAGGERIYKLKGANASYRTLKEAIDVEWDLYGEEYKGKNYPGFGTPIPNKEILFSVYNHLFGHLTEDTDWISFVDNIVVNRIKQEYVVI